jgi:NAD(P)H-flavin reductase
MTAEPILTPHPIKGSPGWFVKISFPDGRERRISRFVTEAEAEAWIANESDDWLAGMGEGR